jgi:hypothetical protein
MEVKKEIEKHAKPVTDETVRPKIKFRTHCIVLVFSMIALATVVSLHIFSETANVALTFVPNFIVEMIDRIKWV